MPKTVPVRFVIIGSGGSSSLPNLRHVLQNDAGCKVCHEAWENPDSKNRRGNPCLLVTVRDPASEPQHLLVDCGKTFEEAVRRHFPRLGIQGVNAVLLTHGHADAILGLDSLHEVWSHFHYMLPVGSGSPSLRRRTSTSRIATGLAPHRVADFQKFQPLSGLQVQPLPVLHGGTYVCMGFRFGAKGEFIYLSDVSKVPDDTMAILKSTQAEVLVVDALLKSGPHYSHFGLPQALELVRLLRPKRALLIGMSCQFDHFHDNQELFKLRSEGLHVELSYDGLELEMNLTLDDDVPLLEEETYELQLPPPPPSRLSRLRVLGRCLCCS